MALIKTKINTIKLNTDSYGDSSAAARLMNRLAEVNHKPVSNIVYEGFMATLAADGREVFVDTTVLESDGWNLRVDGVPVYVPSLINIGKRYNDFSGWSVDISPEMVKACEEQLYCPRCSKQYDEKGVSGEYVAATLDGFLWCPICTESHDLQKHEVPKIQLRKWKERGMHRSVGYSLNVPYAEIMAANVESHKKMIRRGAPEGEAERITRLKEEVLIREWCLERSLNYNDVTQLEVSKYLWFAANPINDETAEYMHKVLVFFPGEYQLQLHNDRVHRDPRETYAE